MHAPADLALRARLGPSIRSLESAWGRAAWSPGCVDGELDHPDAWVAILEDEGRAAAWLCARFVLDEGELLRVAVRPDAVRRGHARRLLVAWLEAAQSRGCSRVHLEVAAGNEGAGALYRALGFTVVGRRPGYYRHPPDDALLMRRDLGEPVDPAL